MQSLLTEAVLLVKRVQIASGVELAHAKAMLGGKNALYPMNRGDIEVMSVAPGQQTVTRDNLFTARLPKKLVIGMVTNDVFNGAEASHSFQFKHFSLKTLEVTVDGENVCGTPLNVDFNDNRYMQAYNGLFNVLNKSYSDSGTDITYEDFKNGYSLFCFDLTADGCGNTTGHFELLKQGNLRIKMQFASPLHETINIIFYGEHESLLEVTSNREVLVDYKK